MLSYRLPSCYESSKLSDFISFTLRFMTAECHVVALSFSSFIADAARECRHVCFYLS